MRTRILIFIAIAIASVLPAKHVIDSGRQPEYLYVLSMEKGTVEKDMLTLKGINTVIYFSDRPSRVAGHVQLSDFGAIWTSEDIKKAPPRATLSIFDSAENVEIVIEILDVPMVSGRDITFRFRSIDNELPGKEFGTASLFVDVITNPTDR